LACAIALLKQEPNLCDTFICEGQDPVMTLDPVDPDHAVLWLETKGQFMDETFFDAEVFGDALDGWTWCTLLRCMTGPLRVGVAVYRLSGSMAASRRAGSDRSRSRRGTTWIKSQMIASRYDRPNFDRKIGND
jgi:hypothetical protein